MKISTAIRFATGVAQLTRAALLLWLLSFGIAQAQSTQFSYQGRLTDNSLPANGTYDFQFKLFDAVSGGTQVGTTVSPTNINVSSGIFTVTLDFGAGAFPGPNRFLEINVRLAGGGAFTTLAPRQPVTSTPYAIKSLNAANAAVADNLSALCNGCVTSTQIASLPTGSGNYIQNGTLTQSSSNFRISGVGSAQTMQARGLLSVDFDNSFNGDLVNNLNTLKFGSAAGLAPGTEGIASKRTAVGNQFGLDFFTNNVSRLAISNGGNVGIGTTAPAAKLEVAGDIRSSALRQELTAYTPNVINGFMGTGSSGATPGNRVTAGVVGATIGGGGFNGTINFPTLGPIPGDNSNRVTDWFGTVSGGFGNRAGNDDATLDNALMATVGGGLQNTASHWYAAVSGGHDNTASNQGATVGGGSANLASGLGAAVGGGTLNTASAEGSTVPGGLWNTAAGIYSLAAGQRAKANHAGAFVWGDSNDADFVSTGANQFLIRAAGGVGIGTNAPTAMLHVSGGDVTVSTGKFNGDGSGLTNLNATNLATGTLPIARGGTGITATPTAAGQFLRSTGANTWAVGSLAASDLPSGSGNYIRNDIVLQANSNFWISGTGQAQNLHATQAVSVDINGLFDGNFIGTFGGLRFGDSGTGSGEGIASKRTAGGNANGLDFFTNYTARLSITNGGNVGIGTTAPDAKLHVSGGSIMLDNNQAFFIKDSTNIAKRVLFAGADNVLRLGSGGGGGFTHVAFDLPGAADVLWLTPGGNVGLGTSSPADKLQVLGDLRVGTGTTGCVKDADGSVIAGVCSSDLRFKKNVAPLSQMLSKVA